MNGGASPLDRRVDRRTVLRAALSAGAALGLPGLLAACGTTVHVAGNRTTYAIDALGTSPPVGDLARLLTAEARAAGVDPVLTAGGALALPGQLRRQTALGAFDAKLNRRPPVTSVLVVAAVAPAASAPLLATALARGVKVVSYPLAAAHQTAAVLATPARAAAQLAAHAARWREARGRGGRADVLLVLPPPAAAGLSPYAGDDGVERALRAAVARALPGAPITTVPGSDPTGGAAAIVAALHARPSLDTVLAWDDDTALGVVAGLRDHPTRAGLYVGALGAPAVTSRATLSALARDDLLRAVVAVRPRDLAAALVALPRDLLTEGSTRDRTLAPETLTPGSRALADYGRDYARTPATTSYLDTALNPRVAR